MRSFLSGSLSAALVMITSASANSVPAPATEGNRYLNLALNGKACGVVQIALYPDTQTIIGSIVPINQLTPENPRSTLEGILYRHGDGPWLRAPISDQVGAHSLIRLPSGRWLMNDGAHGRMVEVDDLSGAGKVISKYELGGIALQYPHDQIVDPKTGYIYVIDLGRLFRFKDLEGPVDIWSFTPEQLVYSRSLAWFDDHLHIINTSRGEVMRIDDFDKRLLTVFKSPRPHIEGVTVATPFGDVDSGALSTTGLVLDSVVKSDDGWYYGSNDFSQAYAMGGDPRPARLIRWRSWEDFAHGNWQDLSAYIPASDVPLFPYKLMIHNDILYAGVVSRDIVPKTGQYASPCGYETIMMLDLHAIGR